MNVIVPESEKLEQLTNDQSNDCERADNSVRQNKVLENKIDDQVFRAVSSARARVVLECQEMQA